MKTALVPIAAALLAGAPLAHAAIVITSPTQGYQQDFDTLASTGTGTWANDSTLLGWYLYQSPAVAQTSYLTGTGSGTTGGFYSFGTTAADRALGGLGSNAFNAAGNAYIAAQFTNSTGQALDGFTLAFNGEQWRNGGNTTAQTMVLEYGFGASFAGVSTWTAPGGTFNWTSPVATATGAAVDGNVAGRVSNRGGTINTNWAPGTTLWVRWIEANDANSDHALAIDTVRFTAGSAVPAAVPLPAAAWLMGPGLAALAALGRRRRGRKDLRA